MRIRFGGENRGNLRNEIDVSGTTVGRYEKGFIGISVSALPIASDVYDFSLRDYLIEWENVKSSVRDAL